MRNFAIKRLWLASAWLMGASYRQLGVLHDVTHNTILQSVNKAIPVEDRKGKRLRFSMKPSELVWYREQFQQNVQELRDMQPLQAGAWLLSHKPYPGD